MKRLFTHKMFGLGFLLVLVCIALVLAEVRIRVPRGQSLFSRIGVPTSEVQQIGAPAEVRDPAADSFLIPLIVPKEKGDESLPYGDVVELYGSKRIQFSPECTMTPQSITYAEGSVILLDNRSPDLADISVGGIVYRINPFSVRVLELLQTGTFSVDCNQSKNVGSLIVQ